MARILLASLSTAIGLAMLSSASEAASTKPQTDRDCLKWVLFKSTGNWVDAPNGEYWMCVQGPHSGIRVALGAGASRGSGGGGDNNGGDNNGGNENGGDDSVGKPGWGVGTTGHFGPPGQIKKGLDGKTGPPGLNK